MNRLTAKKEDRYFENEEFWVSVFFVGFEDGANVYKMYSSGDYADSIYDFLEIKVQTETLDSSNVDVMLYSVFESEEALKGYAVHPEHVKVADTFVRPFTETRSCIDFEEK